MDIFWFRLRHRWRKRLRQVGKILRTPICWMLGHELYTTSDWGGGHQRCSRCPYRITVWKPITNKENKP
jgi:hypothetical protein